MADALSKGDWDSAWPLMPRKEVDPRRVPRTILKWIQHPQPDMLLGEKILAEMDEYTEVLYMDI